MVIAKPNILNPWCCFISSLAGVIVSLIMLFAILNLGSNCRIILWSLVTGVVFIMLGNRAIQLQKLYLVFSRHMMCYVLFSFLMWYWLVVNVPINLLFSAIFCYISYKQYRTFGSEAWKKLAHDGIQTMCLVLLCNIVCCIIIAIQLFGMFSDMFFAID